MHIVRMLHHSSYYPTASEPLAGALAAAVIACYAYILQIRHCDADVKWKTCNPWEDHHAMHTNMKHERACTQIACGCGCVFTFHDITASVGSEYKEHAQCITS
jgi:hypothetical protein